MRRNVSSTRRGYGAAYRRARAAILGPSGGGLLPFDPPCHWKGPNCAGIAMTADHEPPMEAVGRPHLNLVPSCAPCNYGRRHRLDKPPSPGPSREW